jgi:hypothetical protein
MVVLNYANFETGIACCPVSEKLRTIVKDKPEQYAKIFVILPGGRFGPLGLTG